MYSFSYFNALRDGVKIGQRLNIRFCRELLGGQWAAVTDEIVHDEVVEITEAFHVSLAAYSIKRTVGIVVYVCISDYKSTYFPHI